MRSYITSQLTKRLNLETSHADISVVGISEGKTKVSSVVHANISSLNSNFNIKLSFLVLPKITEPLPATHTNLFSLPLPQNILLANPHFNKGSKINILLGVDVFWKVIETEQPYLNEYPYLIDSKLGVLVSGSFLLNSPHAAPVTSSNISLAKVSKQISRFWEQENCEWDLHPLLVDQLDLD